MEAFLVAQEILGTLPLSSHSLYFPPKFRDTLSLNPVLSVHRQQNQLRRNFTKAESTRSMQSDVTTLRNDVGEESMLKQGWKVGNWYVGTLCINNGVFQYFH